MIVSFKSLNALMFLNTYHLNFSNAVIPAGRSGSVTAFKIYDIGVLYTCRKN